MGLLILSSQVRVLPSLLAFEPKQNNLTTLMSESMLIDTLASNSAAAALLARLADAETASEVSAALSVYDREIEALS